MRPAREAEAGQDERDGHGDEQEDAVEDAPAHRAEQPLAEEQRAADDEQRGPRTRTRTNAATTRPVTWPSLAADDRQLGLGQVDVRLDEAPSRHHGSRRSGRAGPGGGAVGRGRVLLGRGRRGRGALLPWDRRWRPGQRTPLPACGHDPDARGRAAMIAAPSQAAPPSASRRWLARPRRLLTAELLSIGTELTVGETRDTNAGELAAVADGGRRDASAASRPCPIGWTRWPRRSRPALARVDLVVSTGGLGPTPDDLTREAIAAVLGETPSSTPSWRRWLRAPVGAPRLPFPEPNRKQAWLIPSAPPPCPTRTARRPAGSSPLDRTAERIVALPGPPREMRPMWEDHALPRSWRPGLGADVAARTFRLTGIGESQVAEILGEALLRRTNPDVATYARAEAVDVRVSAVGDATGGRGRARRRAPRRSSRERLGRYVWATGATTWSDAIGEGWRPSAGAWPSSRSGPAARSATLLGDVDWLVRDGIGRGRPGGRDRRRRWPTPPRRVRERGGAQVGLAVAPASARRRGHGRADRGRHPRTDSARTPGRRSCRLPGPVPGGAGRGGGPAAAAAASRRYAPARRRRASAAGGGAQAVDVDDDDRVALRAEQAVVGELAEQLVHALARAPDHRREVALGQVGPEPDAAVGGRRPALAGQSDELGRQPTRDVQEVQLLDVQRQPTQLAGDGGQQRVAEARSRSAMSSRNRSRGRTTVSVARAPSRWRIAARRRAGRAPRTRRRRRVARMASSPVSDGSEIFTSPLTDDEQRIPGVPDVEDDLARAGSVASACWPPGAGGRRLQPGEERDGASDQDK